MKKVNFQIIIKTDAETVVSNPEEEIVNILESIINDFKRGDVIPEKRYAIIQDTQRNNIGRFIYNIV